MTLGRRRPAVVGLAVELGHVRLDLVDQVVQSSVDPLLSSGRSLDARHVMVERSGDRIRQRLGHVDHDLPELGAVVGYYLGSVECLEADGGVTSVTTSTG